MAAEKIALAVTLTLHPGKREAFLERVARHAKICREQEPGCLDFQVLVPREGDDKVLLHEVYAGEEAVEAHLSSAHMKEYLADTGPWIAERQRVACVVREG